MSGTLIVLIIITVLAVAVFFMVKYIVHQNKKLKAKTEVIDRYKNVVKDNNELVKKFQESEKEVEEKYNEFNKKNKKDKLTALNNLST